MKAERWEVQIRAGDESFIEHVDIDVDEPMKQAGAEVRAIRKYQEQFPGRRVRCTYSRFVEELEVDG